MILLKNSIYLYNVDNLRLDYNLPISLIKHIEKYKDENIRNISRSNYSNLAIKLKELGLDINNLKFIKKNKPCIDGIYLSMSHSKEFYGFILSDEECGFDIELLINEKRFSLANRILNEDELNEFTNNVDKSKYLTTKWCQKEAYSKHLGTGLNSSIFKMKAAGSSFTIGNSVVAYTLSNADIYLNDRLL